MQLVRFTKFWANLDAIAMGGRAARLGYDGLDLAVRAGHAIDLGNVASALPVAVARWADMGIVCPMISTDVSLIDPTSEATRALFHAAGECGVQGIKIGYFVHPAGEPFELSWSRAKQALCGFEALARDSGVQVWLHSHGGRCLGSTCAGLRHLLDDLDPKWLRAYPDLGHLAVGGEDIDVGFAMLRERLSAVAAKDALHQRMAAETPERPTQVAFVPLGHGAAQLTTAMKLLAQMNFRGPVSVHTEYTSDAQIIATVGGADDSAAAAALRERGEVQDLALLRRLWAQASARVSASTADG